MEDVLVRPEIAAHPRQEQLGLGHLAVDSQMHHFVAHALNRGEREAGNPLLSADCGDAPVGRRHRQVAGDEPARGTVGDASQGGMGLFQVHPHEKSTPGAETVSADENVVVGVNTQVFFDDAGGGDGRHRGLCRLKDAPMGEVRRRSGRMHDRRTGNCGRCRSQPLIDADRIELQVTHDVVKAQRATYGDDELFLGVIEPDKVRKHPLSVSLELYMQEIVRL
mmetsp:Transcript_9045/g.24364  ORF Transcript_9045/g.24364 Transcript_9045/m.24364 type:complete len:222 (+) Transcript_9045:426-1091(+)